MIRVYFTRALIRSFYENNHKPGQRCKLNINQKFTN